LPNERRVWLVQGYDGTRQIFRTKLSPVLSEREIGTLLQRLSARDLSLKEIVSASLRKSMKGYHPFLEIKRELGRKIILSVGVNPHYIASQHTEHELKDMEHDDAPWS
jgi:hypothetical protein